MALGVVQASHSFPEWQAVKLQTFFAHWHSQVSETGWFRPDPAGWCQGNTNFGETVEPVR